MLNPNHSVEMCPMERVLLERKDIELIVHAIYGDVNGWCNLSEDFVKAIIKLNEPRINDMLFSNSYIFPKEVIDSFFDNKDLPSIRRLFISGYDDYHRFDSEQGVKLLKLEDEFLTPAYMRKYGEFIFDLGWYAPVAEYLKEVGKYEEFYEQYSVKARKKKGKVKYQI